MYLHGGVVRSQRPELLWPHFHTGPFACNHFFWQLLRKCPKGPNHLLFEGEEGLCKWSVGGTLMAVGSKATDPSFNGHTSTLTFQPLPYICVSVVNITPCPPQKPTPLRLAVRLRIPKPMLPSPALG